MVPGELLVVGRRGHYRTAPEAGDITVAGKGTSGDGSAERLVSEARRGAKEVLRHGGIGGWFGGRLMDCMVVRS